MQLRFAKLRSASPARASRRAILLFTPALLLLLSACAVQKPYQFHANTITRISYDPKNCAELPDGTFRCKDVIFHVATIEPLTAKK